MPVLDREGYSIFWRVDGDETRTRLILLNSLGTDQSSWDSVMPHLLNQFCVMRMDKSGHGGSTPRQGRHTIAQFGDDVLAVMDAAGWKSANLCGVSIGGMAGIYLGRTAPHRFDKLILSNTSAFIAPKVLRERIDKIRSDGLSSVTDQVLARFFSQKFIQKANPDYHSFVRVFQQTDADSYVGWSEAICDMDFREYLKEIFNPVLVITGKHDEATTPEMGRDIVAGIPGAQHVELLSSHLPFAEYPKDYAEVITRFALSDREKQK